VRRAALALGLLALAFFALTWIALESGGVARLETHRADGTLRETHVWFVEREGATWLEAGAPENGWFADVQRDRRLRIRTVGVWRDAWVGLLVDSTRSVAVRLLAEAEQRQ